MLGLRKILLISKLRDVPCFNNNKNDNIHIFLTFVFRLVFVDIIGVDFQNVYIMQEMLKLTEKRRKSFKHNKIFK